MHWMLIGYMFLFIHRPFEVWPWLGELHVERLYMLLTLAVWLWSPLMDVCLDLRLSATIPLGGNTRLE